MLGAVVFSCSWDLFISLHVSSPHPAPTPVPPPTPPVQGSIYMVFDYMDHDMTGLLERSRKEGPQFTAPQVRWRG